MSAQTRTFTMAVERDPDSGWYVGYALGLPGCHTEAPSMVDLETAMREAISVYLASIEPDDALPTYIGTRLIDVPA